MPPVVVAPTADDWQLLRQGGALVVDASASTLIPPSWRETFNLRWLALAPLIAGGQPCGVLVADHGGDDEPPFDGEALQILQSVAALAGSVYNWSNEDDWVARSSSAAATLSRRLATAADVAAVANAFARYLRSSCGASGCRLIVRDQETVLASVTTGDADDATLVAPDSDAAQSRAFHVATDASGISVLRAQSHDSSVSVAATLTAADTPRELWPALESATLQSLSALRLLSARAELVAAQAIERAHRAVLEIPAQCHVDELVERLAPNLRGAYGLEPVELVLLPPYRRSLDARAPSRDDVRHLKEWTHDAKQASPADSRGRRLIPLRLGPIVVGALAVRVVNQRKAADTTLFARCLALALHARHLDRQVSSGDATAQDDAQRLEQVASGIGHVLHLLREPAAASAVGGGQTSHSTQRATVPSRLVEELKDLEEMCRMRATSGGGLLQTIRELASAAEPMQVTIKTHGKIALVPAQLASGLPLAVRELIELAARSRARFVVLTITSSESESEISFRADGHLAAADQATTLSTYETIRGLQRMLQSANASLRLHNASSHFLVEIKHPAEQRPDLPRPRTLKPRGSA
jgi:hypothetical protein